jgi:hypothetical protein
MALRSQTDKKTTQNSASAPVQTSLRTRPFAPQVETTSESAHDLQAQ